MQIIDVTNPKEPKIAGAYQTKERYPGKIYTVFNVANYVYLGDCIYGLEIIDVTNPAKVKLAGKNKGFDCGASDMRISGHYAYVTSYGNGLLIYDIGNPLEPKLVGSECITLTDMQSALGIDIFENYAFVLTEHFLYLLDISNPSKPTLSGKCEIKFNGPITVKVINKYIYVSDYGFGLKIIGGLQ